MNSTVLISDEHFNPIAQVVVEAFDLATNTVVATLSTGINGLAAFVGLPGDKDIFYRPRITRPSGKGGDQGHSGVVRVHVVA